MQSNIVEKKKTLTQKWKKKYRIKKYWNIHCTNKKVPQFKILKMT